MGTATYCFSFSLFFNRRSMYVERWRAVRRVPTEIPMVFVPDTLFAESTKCSGWDALRRRPGVTSTLPNGKEIDNS
jgi:hypothetical protein